MIIVVHDANILIDLYKTDLLKSFCSLGFENHTTNLVLEEIEQSVHQYVQTGLIQQHTLTSEQLEQTREILTTEKRVSLSDCSVLWLTKELGDTTYLLTGDKQLRKCAEKREINVRGLLWIFDQFVEKKIIPTKTMANKLQKLLAQGGRLPIEESQKRILNWNGSKTN